MIWTSDMEPVEIDDTTIGTAVVRAIAGLTPIAPHSSTG